MMKFTRSAAPSCLKKYKQWGREYAAKQPPQFLIVTFFLNGITC